MEQRGRSQQNPHNAAEVVGAVSALNFFSGAIQETERGNYLIATSSQSVGKRFTFTTCRVTRLRVSRSIGARCPSPRSCAIGHHQIPWDQDVRRWTGTTGSRRSMPTRSGKTTTEALVEALKIIERFGTFSTVTKQRMADDDLRQVTTFFADDVLSVEACWRRRERRACSETNRAHR